MMKFLRTVVSFLLCAALLVSLPLCATADDSYTDIYTAAQLSGIRDNLSGQYRLMADIAFTEADFAAGGAFYNDGKGWEPIGKDYAGRFAGVLDGNGHAVSGLTLRITEAQGVSTVYAGLFGVAGGTIKDLRLVDTTIYVANCEYTNAGAVVGGGTGNIINCAVENIALEAENVTKYANTGGIAGRMFSGIVEGCTSSGTTGCVAVGASAGGLVGQSNATIRQSLSATTVGLNSTSDCYAGGIVARNTGKVEACRNEGTLNVFSEMDGNVGGIAGFSSNAIRDCLSVGTQERRISHYDNYGGICGTNQSTITRCYFDAAGVDDEVLAMSGANARTAAQLANAATYAGWNWESEWNLGAVDRVDTPLPIAVARLQLRRQIDELCRRETGDAYAYTAASWSAWQTAIATAKALPADASLSDCAAARDALAAAYDGLVGKALSYTVVGEGSVALSGDPAYGQTTTLTATPDPGWVFVGYHKQEGFSTNATLSVRGNGRNNVVAYFRRESECAVVFHGKYNSVISVQVIASADDLLVPDAPALPGYRFVAWDSDLDVLILEAGLISVNAIYTEDEAAPHYTLTLIDAAADIDTADLVFDTRVTITPALDEPFSHWLINGAVAATNPRLTLYVAGNDTIQAVYQSDTVTLSPSVSISQTAAELQENGKYKLSVIGQIYAPQDAVIVEYGTLFAADARSSTQPDTFVWGTTAYSTQIVTASSVHANRRYLTYLSGTRAGATRYARGYLIVQLGDTRSILYSDVVTLVAE